MLSNEITLALLVVILSVLLVLVVRQAEMATAIRALLARTGSLATEADQELQADIVALLGQGRSRDAIRAYRRHFGASLVDAAAAVETIARQQRRTG